MSRQRGNRLTECKALMVCGEALKCSGGGADPSAKAQRANDYLDLAEQLIATTGAIILESELALAHAA